MSSPPPDSSSAHKEPLYSNEAVEEEAIGDKDGRSVEAPDQPFLQNYHRCILFFILEAAFLALAAYLQAKSIPLPHRFPDFISTSFITTLIKGAISFMLNTWHGIAAAIASTIICDAFSREWKFRQTRPVAVKSKSSIDSVSIISSGLLNRVSYIISGRNPSKAFLTSFIASVWMICLSTAGPSAVVVENGMETQPITVGGLVLGTSPMTFAILKVEQTLGLKLGYDTQANWIIPKPASDASQKFGDHLLYNSDVIHFSHTCEWHKPTFANTITGGKVEFGGQEFSFVSFIHSPSTADQGRASTTSGTGVFPVLPYLSAVSSTSAFLIFGGNSSLPLNKDPIFGDSSTSLGVLQWQRASGNTIDLSHIETTYEPSWYNFTAGRFKTPSGGDLVFRAPLAAGLLCDAHSELKAGQVRLASNKLTVASSDLATGVGNIKETDVPKYFSRALQAVGAIEESVLVPDPDVSGSVLLLVDFNPLAMRLLLPGSAAGSLTPDASIPPLPLDQIAQNMDIFVSSASKAQMVEGSQAITDRDILAGSSGSSQTLFATGPIPNLVLSSNPIWFGLTVLLVLGTLGLCIGITVLIKREEGVYPPFELYYIKNHSE